MAPCKVCAGLDVELLRDNDVLFHESLRALKASAEDACEFCVLCWTAIQDEWLEDKIEACLEGKAPSSLGGLALKDSRMWLRGDILDLGRRSGIYTSARSHILVSCGRYPGNVEGPNLPDTNYGLGLTATLHIFADPGTSAAARFPERFTTVDRNPDYYVDFTKTFLTICRSTSGHKACGYSEEDIPDHMPTRVLDVGKPATGIAPRLVLSKGLRQPYTALSYCWGPGAQNTTMLRDENLEAFLTAIDESLLTRTHSEAMQLTRRLGIQYLWIDALCIIQGNRDDWGNESARMAEVYGNAALTIVAGRAADTNNGFIANNLSQPVKPVSFPYKKDDISQSSIFVTLPRKPDVGPVDTRGWCFQESLLSRRAIRFGTDQLSFQCRSFGLYEDGLTVTNDTEHPTHPTQLAYTQSSSPKANVVRQWYNAVQQFSQRDLTEPHDVFVAVSSLAQCAHRSLQCRYLAGLWECDVVVGLMWRARYQVQAGGWKPLSRPRASGRWKTEAAGEVITRAPSWTWASAEGTVHWNVQKIDTTRELHDIDPGNSYIRPGQQGSWTTQSGCEPNLLDMQSCALQIYGRPRQVLCSETPIAKYPRPRNLESPAGPRRKLSEWISKRKQKFCVVLEAQGAGRKESSLSWDNEFDAAVGVGRFDFPDEKHPDALWCLRLAKEDGLILGRDDRGNFYRLGWFLVENGEWLDAGQEVKFDLV